MSARVTDLAAPAPAAAYPATRIRRSGRPVVRRLLGPGSLAALHKPVVNDKHAVLRVAAWNQDGDTYDLTGPDGPVAGVASDDPAYRWAWEATWGAQVDQLTTGNSLLGPKNGFAYVWDNPQAAAARTRFVDALRGPLRPAAEARAALDEIRSAMVPPKAHPNASKMPTTMYNDLLEFVSAKVLYERGDASLQPGVPFRSNPEAEAMFPDYSVRGQEASAVVGDHVRVAKGKNAKEVGGFVAADVIDKLDTYPVAVRVVVDVTSAPGAGGTDIATIVGEATTALSEKLRHYKHGNRLVGVDVILGSNRRTITPAEVLG